MCPVAVNSVLDIHWQVYSKYARNNAIVATITATCQSRAIALAGAVITLNTYDAKQALWLEVTDATDLHPYPGATDGTLDDVRPT